MLMILLEQTTTSPNRSSGAKVTVTVSTGPATQILQLEFIQLQNAGGNNVSVLNQNTNYPSKRSDPGGFLILASSLFLHLNFGLLNII